MFAKRKERGLREAGWGWTVFAGSVGFIYFFPVLWIILTAFKTRADALATPPKFIFTPTLDNFVSVATLPMAFAIGSPTRRHCMSMIIVSTRSR